MYFGYVIIPRVIVLPMLINYVSSNHLKIISDSDLFLDSPQLMAKYGYASQNHTVITEDGYKLSIFRIQKTGPPILLVHGIGDSSDSWLIFDRSHSLAYQLSDLNYDVWIYNARGNKYSKGHIENIPRKQYWDFSYEEMGSQDLPAVVDHILSTTSHTKLSYVGFSQGTTIFFVMTTMKPEYNKKIQNAFLLAPITTVKNIIHPFVDIFTNNIDFVSSFVNDIGVYELFSDNVFFNLYHAKVCRGGELQNVLCLLEFFLNYGVTDLKKLVSERLPALASHIPAGVSTKTFLHYFQSYISGQFQRFDYGNTKNIIMYNSSKPPKYNLKLVEAPLYLFASETDWFSRIDNVKEAVSQLPNVVSYVVLNATLDFTHLEYVYGSRNSLVNDRIISILTSNA